MGNLFSRAKRDEEATAAAAPAGESKATTAAVGGSKGLGRRCMCIMIGHSRIAGKNELMVDLKKPHSLPVAPIFAVDLGFDYCKAHVPLPIGPAGTQLNYICNNPGTPERFRTISPAFCRTTNTLLFVYSVADRKSWDLVVRFSRSILDTTDMNDVVAYMQPIVLCATSTDLRPNCPEDEDELETWVLPCEEASLKKELLERVLVYNRAVAEKKGHWDAAQDAWNAEAFAEDIQIALNATGAEDAQTMGIPLCFLGDAADPMAPAGAATVQHIQIASNMQNNLTMHRVCAVVGAMHQRLLDIEQGMFCLREERKWLLYRDEGAGFPEDSWTIGDESVLPFSNGKRGAFKSCCEMQQRVVMMLVCRRLSAESSCLWDRMIPPHLRLRCMSYLEVCSLEHVWRDSDTRIYHIPLSQARDRGTVADIQRWCDRKRVRSEIK